MKSIFRTFGLVALLLCATGTVTDPHGAGLPLFAENLEQAPSVREIVIRARRYAFSPARLEVNQGDIVRITLVAEDIPHSFTVDEYRISKRASPDRNVTFEFRADTPGTFVFYCSLTIDERCRDMRGELIVR